MNQSYLGFKDELGNDDRMLLGNSASFAKISLQILGCVGHTHSRSTEDVRRPYEAREPNIVAKLDGRFQVGQFFPPMDQYKLNQYALSF